MKNLSFILCWISAIFVILIGFTDSKRVMNFQIQDTYLETTFMHIALFFTFGLTGLGIIYWLLRKRRTNDFLTIIHLFFTLIPVVVVFIEMVTQNKTLDNLVHILSIFFLLVQPLFFINIVLGIVRKSR
jgi:hypothetical protein